VTTRLDPVQLLKDLVAVPSVSGDEERVVDAVHRYAKAGGLPAERAGRNVVISFGSGQGPRLLLNAHLDTVAPVSRWETDPFTPVERDGRITGLGANDDKGSVVAILCALANLNQTGVPGNVVLALTVEEERGGGEGLERLITQLGELDAAVIGEPTDLQICRAQKGLLVLEVETTGVARHAAHAHRMPGPNAVVEAAKAVLALDGWSPGPKHELLGPVTCQVTVIQGGTTRNVIPDRCAVTLDVRTVPGSTTDGIVRAIEEKTKAKVKVVSDRLKPVETDEKSAIVQAACRARPEASVVASSTLSDAVWTRHLPTIKVGPGMTERSHTAGEYILVSELMGGVSFYERLVQEYFQ